MSGFDPTFDAAGVGTTDGSVPAPGAIDGRTFYLRADKTWAAPGGVAPGPEPPAPGPDLDLWACNIAGYLTYEVSRLAVKYVVDWLPVSWIGDVAGGILAGLAGLLLPASLLVDGVVEAAIFHWVSTYVSGHITDIGAALVDDVAWAKLHCALYAKILLTPTDLRAAILAFTAILGGLVGWTTPAVAAITYLFEHLGIADVGNIPITAFVRDYDCSTCGVTGIGPTKPILQTAFDLTITDGTTSEAFRDTVDFVGATVGGSGSTATVTPNNATSSTVGVARPDNTTLGVAAGVLSVLATPAVTNFYSTVGVGKKLLLGVEPAGWQAVGFDDSAWTVPILETGGGPTPSIAGAARITSNDGNVSTSAVFLFRLAFTLPPGAILSGVSTILEDNTSTVWINGTEISTYTRPPTDTSGAHATSFDVTLLSTNNVLAIKIENGAFGFGANPMSLEYLLAITQASDGALAVEHGGSVVGSRRAINLTDGGGVTWTVADNSALSRVDISAAAPGFTNPMTTAADLIVGGTAGAAARLAKGSDGQVLTVDPSTHLLVWATPSSPGTGTVTDVGSSAPITSTGGATPVVGLTTPLDPLYGGTGHDLSAAIDGQIPIASTSDHKFTAGNLTAGAGITITNSGGGISIAASGTGGGGTAMTQLAIVTVAIAANTVTISSIPGTYSHLRVIWLARSTTALTAFDGLALRLNSDNSAIYDWNQLAVLSTVTASETIGDTSFGAGEILQDSLAAGFWSMGEIFIPFYAQTNTNKVIQSWDSSDRHAGANTNRALQRWGTWRSTAAVSSLEFLVASNNFKVGTTFSLYGIA